LADLFHAAVTRRSAELVSDLSLVGRTALLEVGPAVLKVGENTAISSRTETVRCKRSQARQSRRGVWHRRWARNSSSPSCEGRASWPGIGYALGFREMEEHMKKAAKRGKAKTSSKRAPVRSRITKTAAKVRTKLARATSAVRPSSKARTRSASKRGSRVKKVAEKAATAAVVAAGTAALGTALAELRPDTSNSENAAETAPTPADEPK
jgi:hypothetical protein